MSQQPIDVNLLRQLIPAGSLKPENFRELAAKTTVEDLPAKTVIFKEGDNDRKAIYLVEGEVQVTNRKTMRIVRGGTPDARHPIANQQPRTFTAVTASKCRITRIDADLMDILMTWDQLSGIQVDEITPASGDAEEDTTEGDWMTRILQSKAFLQVPPANIHALFMKVQEMPVKKGETIIKQGDDGDNYYIIKRGKCKISRTTKTGSEVVLANLSDGDAFGEEALLSETKRNANVTMTSDGALMRLSKQDFDQLLKEPMLNWIEPKEADALIKSGDGTFVDVRLDSEHKNNGLPGSINIPLFMLRLKAEALDPAKKYVLYCDSGRRSSAGAFILSERGIKTFCLKGGLVGYNPS